MLIPIKDGKVLLQGMRQMAIDFRPTEKPQKCTEHLQKSGVFRMVKNYGTVKAF